MILCQRDVSEHIKTMSCCTTAAQLPVVSKGFSHLIMDYVGLLLYAKYGYKFMLIVTCQSTRYPALYPLRFITTNAVVKALLQFISVFATLKMVQYDCV